MAAQMVSGGSSGVYGAKEFAAALKATDRNVWTELGKTHKKIGDLVVERAKSNANAVGPQAAVAATTVTSTASKFGVYVKEGNTSVPFALGAEFGAKAWHQFKAWRGNQFSGWPEGVGYFFHPAIREERDTILELYIRSIQTAASKAGISSGITLGGYQ